MPKFERRYAVMVERAYPPGMLLLKQWLFGATAGVYSSRELARWVRWYVRFRYLERGLRPAFRTISRLCTRHREKSAEIFRQKVQMAKGARLGRLGVVAIDGTNVRANKSLHKAMSRRRTVVEEAPSSENDEHRQLVAIVEG